MARSKVTLEDFGVRFSCSPDSRQAKLFAAEWPQGAQWTAANVRRAADLGLDFIYAASVLLPEWASVEQDGGIAKATATLKTHGIGAYLKSVAEVLIRVLELP